MTHHYKRYRTITLFGGLGPIVPGGLFTRYHYARLVEQERTEIEKISDYLHDHSPFRKTGRPDDDG